MISAAVFDATTNLSALLDKVALGEDVVITKHGKAVARLIKAEDCETADLDAVISKLKKLRIGTTLQADWKQLRDEGRR